MIQPDISEARTRDDAAEFYADMLLRREFRWGGWRGLNLSIIDKWSPSALIYIKRRAWKIARQRDEDGVS